MRLSSSCVRSPLRVIVLPRYTNLSRDLVAQSDSDIIYFLCQVHHFGLLRVELSLTFPPFSSTSAVAYCSLCSVSSIRAMLSTKSR